MKYECEMIRDLMPLCAEDLASEASKTALQAHLAECSECAAEWENVKGGTAAFPETPVPEETRQYARTAKRVRKKHVLAIAATALIVALFFAGAFIKEMVVEAGGRLTPEKAAVWFTERMTDSEGYPTWYAAAHPDEVKANLSGMKKEPVFTEGTMLYEQQCILKYTDAASGKGFLDVINTAKMGFLWFGTGSYGGIEIPAEKGIYPIIDWLRTTHYFYNYVYINDPAVVKIRLQENETTYFEAEVDPDYHICGIRALVSLVGDKAGINGTAYDADGNVRYTLRENVWYPA